VSHPAGRDLTEGDVVLGIRAEGITAEMSSAPDLIPATVVVNEPLGSHNLLTVRAAGGLVKVSVANDFYPEPGSDLWLRFRSEHIRWLDRASGKAVAAESASVESTPPTLVA
jgi:multiple sugar transport system ATP-binding protein